MKKQSKWIIGVVAVVVIAAAITFSNTSLFKGSLQGLNQGSLYRAANIECYDGTATLLGDASPLPAAGFVGFGGGCQSSPAWLNAARVFCANKCNARSGKCGVNSFGVSNPCVQAAAGNLSVQRDVVENIKNSQIVTGTTNVKFAAFKFQTGNVADVSIKKITFRNIGTNLNGIASIGIYERDVLLGGITKPSLGIAGGDPYSIEFDYTTNPIVIQKNTYRVFVVKANTIYSATPGETIQFQIGRIETSDPAVQINGGNSTDNVKVLYPTKLNFAWVAPESQVLPVGNQVEIARFTMGADAANINNPSAYVIVKTLRFTNGPIYRGLPPPGGLPPVPANLANVTLRDIRDTVLATSNSIPPGFWDMNIMLQQGETQTFKIFADVPNEPNKTVQLQFNAGIMAGGGGGAIWDVSSAGVRTVRDIAWTVLLFDAANVISQTLSR